MTVDLRALLLETIYTPPEAGRTLMALDIPREASWMALFLASILNTLAYFINLSLITLPEDMMIPVFETPVIYLMMTFSFSTVIVFAIYWTGQMLGGKARFPVIISMVAWLMCLHGVANLGFIVLLMFVPMIASLFSMLAMLYGLWILLNFIKVGHDFDDMGKPIMTIILALVGLVVGLSVFLSVIGVAAVGIT